MSSPGTTSSCQKPRSRITSLAIIQWNQELEQRNRDLEQRNQELEKRNQENEHKLAMLERAAIIPSNNKLRMSQVRLISSSLAIRRRNLQLVQQLAKATKGSVQGNTPVTVQSGTSDYSRSPSSSGDTSEVEDSAVSNKARSRSCELPVLIAVMFVFFLLAVGQRL